MSANPPRAPGELADELEDAFAQVRDIEDTIGLDDDALDRALDSFAHLCLGLMPDVIASLRSATGDGGEAMRRPIVEYPYEQVGKGSDRWGPEAVLYVPARDDFYPHHEVSYVGHLEAGMWLVRDPEGPCGWGELPVPPSHFILLPPRDDANRLDLQPHSTKIEGADEL